MNVARVSRSRANSCSWSFTALRLTSRSTAVPIRRPVLLRANEPGDVFGKLKDKAYLDIAAKKYAFGVQKGMDEDEMIAMEFGTTVEKLTDLQSEYIGKVKDKLEKRAEEMRAEEQAVADRLARSYTLGKEAYECGEYTAAVRLLERGVEELGFESNLGGDAQLWLALSYQACGREEEAVAACRYVEANHPERRLKKKAADIRYIFEAPKLEISDDERVTIPIMQSETWRKDRKTTVTSKLNKKKVAGPTSYWDRAEWSMPDPDFLPDQWYIRFLWAVVGVTFVVFLNLQAAGPR